MQDKLKTFLAKRGQFVAVKWERPAKCFKTVSDTVTKRVVATNIRAGVNYDNRATVQDKRESGELPAVNQGLNGMQWATDENGNSLFPHVLIGKNGARSFRFDVVANSTFQTEWLLNGTPVEKSAVESLLLASEKQSSSGQLDCLNVKENDILEIV